MEYERVVLAARELGIEPPSRVEFERNNKNRSVPDSVLDRSQKSNHLLINGWIVKHGTWMHPELAFLNRVTIDEAVRRQLESDLLNEGEENA